MKISFFSARVRRALTYAEVLGLIGLAGGLIVLERVYSPEKVRQGLEERFARSLKRDFSMGAVSWEFFPTPTLSAKDLKLKDTRGRVWFAVPSITYEIDFWALFKRKLLLTGGQINAPVVDIHIDEAGNTELTRLIDDITAFRKAQPESKSGFLEVRIQTLHVMKCQLRLFESETENARFGTYHISGTLDLNKQMQPAEFFIDHNTGTVPINAVMTIPELNMNRMDIKVTTPGGQAGEIFEDLVVWKKITSRSARQSSTAKTAGATGHSPSRPPWNIDLSITADTLIFKNARLNEFHLAGRIAQDRSVALNQVQWKTDNGEFTMTGKYSAPDIKTQWTYTSNQLEAPSDFTSQNWKNAALGSSTGTLTGTLHLKSDTKTLDLSAQTLFTSNDKSRIFMTLSNPNLDNNYFNVNLKGVNLEAVTMWSTWQVSQMVMESIESLNRPETNEKDTPDQKSTIDFYIEAEDSHFGHLSLAKTSVTINKDRNGTVAINNGQAEGDSTTLSFWGAFKGDEFAFNWDASRWQVGEIIRAFGFNFDFSGSGATHGNLTGNPSNFLNEQLHGVIYLTLKDGVVGEVPGLLKTLSSLNLKSLTDSKKEKNVKGMEYDVATATVVINNGRLTLTPPASIENKTLGLKVGGTSDLTQRTIDLELTLIFRTIIQEVVHALPWVGPIITQDNKGMVPIIVTVIGPYDNPEIKNNNAASVSKTVGGAVSNVLKIPGRILGSILQLDKK